MEINMKPMLKTDAQRRNNSEYTNIEASYIEATTLIERLHRRLLDLIEDDIQRRGVSDINAVQALLLFNIGDQELSAGELRKRGYYLGSNVSYNLKKLVDLGYLNQQASRADRRSVRIVLTEKGSEIRDDVAELYDRCMGRIEPVGGISAEDFINLNKTLARLDRFWTDHIMYRL